MARELLGDNFDKIMSKTCLPCGKSVGGGDVLDPTRTRAWHKPDWEGRICAYCGVAKFKLWPHLAMAEVRDMIKRDESARKRFFDYIDNMIDHLSSGNTTLKNCPTERVDRTESTGCRAS
eukprot:3496893-Pyramimonas_sp.AAC.1